MTLFKKKISRKTKGHTVIGSADKHKPKIQERLRRRS
jgi:hypothetical protein